MPPGPPELDEPPRRRRTRLATAGLIMAVASCVVFLFAYLFDAQQARVRPGRVGVASFLSLTAIPTLLMSATAMVLGIAGIIRVETSRGRLSGRVAAFAAMILALAVLLPARAVPAPRGGTVHSRCMTNLRQIGLACQLYANDNGEGFPPSLAALYPKYVDNAKRFSCPAGPSKWSEFEKSGRFTRESTSYVYVWGVRRDDPGDCVLAFDRRGNHHGCGRYVLFTDARVTWTIEAGFKEVLDQTREAVRKRGGEIRLVGE